MSATDQIHVRWQEDSTNVILGRVTAEDGSGDATGQTGEGNWLKAADLSSITCKVLERHGDQWRVLATPTVTIANVILDSPKTGWTVDAVGYNFQHALAPSNFPNGGVEVLVQYKFTTSGGAVFHKTIRGEVASIID